MYKTEHHTKPVSLKISWSKRFITLCQPFLITASTKASWYAIFLARAQPGCNQSIAARQ